MKFKRICCVAMAALMMISGMTVCDQGIRDPEPENTE